MSPLKQHIVPLHAKEYRSQEGFKHCGAYAAHAVLGAYGMTNIPDPENLSTHWLSKLTGSSPSKDYYSAILRTYGLNAQTKSAAPLSSIEKLDLLKRLLTAGNPVILNVANFFSRTTGEWVSGKGILGSHWISLWGYDDAEEVFFVYDSLVSSSLADHVPIGNKKRSYATILKIWKGSLPSRTLLGSYLYIDIKRK